MGPSTAARSTSLLVILGALLLPGPASAQHPDAPGELSRSSVYLEILGQGVLYSINYDYRVTPRFSVRAGYSSWTVTPFFLFSTGELTYTGIPLMVNYLTGDGSSHLEIGGGIVSTHLNVEGREIFFGTEYAGSAHIIIGTATLGYRLQPPDGGFTFRIGLTPMFTWSDAALSGGVSLGVAF